MLNSRAFIDQELNIEYAALRQDRHAPEGLYVTLVPGQPRLWQGYMFIRDGIYDGGIFKLSLSFEHWPHDPPEVQFYSKLWHPLISDTGRLSMEYCSNRANNVTQVLFLIRKIFDDDVLKGLQEHEASNLRVYETLSHDPVRFAAMARQCSELSRTNAVLYTQNTSEDIMKILEDDALMPYEETMDLVKEFLYNRQLL